MYVFLLDHLGDFSPQFSHILRSHCSPEDEYMQVVRPLPVDLLGGETERQCPEEKGCNADPTRDGSRGVEAVPCLKLLCPAC